MAADCPACGEHDCIPFGNIGFMFGIQPKCNFCGWIMPPDWPEGDE